MTDDDAERILRDALDRHARNAVGDHAQPPPPRFLESAPRRRHSRLLAPVAAAAAVVAVVGGILALTDRGGAGHSVAGGNSSVSAPPTLAVPPAARVHISLYNADGATYGVGMPVIAYFSRRIANAAALQSSTSVTVDGKPMRGAWYFAHSTSRKYPLEGHFRLASYWPAHAKIHVAIDAAGRSAGGALAFGNNLTLDFTTGAADVATVDDRTHRLTLVRDGKPIADYPVSLGAPSTPTSRGTKVIMKKGVSICMSGPGYSECGIKYTQQLTYSGEYLHAAPWNVSNIKKGLDSSNGCTNLLPGDAARLYDELQVGDVVKYPDAAGPPMQLDAGFGDWNVPWSVWQRGGIVPTA